MTNPAGTLVVLLLLVAPAHALDATCGMTVADGNIAVLQADLDCDGTQIAITLGSPEAHSSGSTRTPPRSRTACSPRTAPATSGAIAARG